MKSMSIKKAQAGFTLIEIAIVLVIVGLLLGGVLQGQQLIENSRVRAAVNDFNGVPAAFWQHLKAAGFIPGDPDTIGAQALPQNPFGGLIGVNASAIQGMPAGVNKLCMNNVGGSAALALDGRLDDGSPDSGNFRANAATTPNATAATVYDVNLLYTVCNRM